MKNFEPIILVDVSTILHKVRLTKQDKLYGTELIDIVARLKKQLGSNRVIMVQDFGGSRYRKELYPEYKGHRANKEMTAEEEEKLNIMREWNKNLHLFYPMFEAYSIFGVEADDLCSILYWNLKQEGYEVIVATNDKDYLGCIPTTNLYNIFKERYYNEEDRKGLNRKQFKIMQGLLGDSIDNIKGICGEKTAIVLANNFTSYKDMRNYNGDVNLLAGITPHNKRYVEKALADIKKLEIWNDLKLSYNLTSIFMDTKNLNETECDKYYEIEESIKNFDYKAEFEITSELEDFLENVGEQAVLCYLESLV